MKGLEPIRRLPGRAQSTPHCPSLQHPLARATAKVDNMHKSRVLVRPSRFRLEMTEIMHITAVAARRNTRLMAASLLLVVAVVSLHYLARWKNPSWQPWVTAAAALVSIAIGVTVIRAFVSGLVNRSVDYLGMTRVQSARSVVSGVLYLLLVLVVASQTEIDLSGIALSGAVTGVIVGIAAQASIANVVAGLVILFARPFRPGQYVTVRAAAFAGSEYSGVVGEITLFFTTILSGEQEIRVPNSSMVTSVVTLRPQLFDVYLPVLIPLAQWHDLSMTELSSSLGEYLPARRAVFAQVERMEAGSVQVGIRASLATMEERSSLERAVVATLGNRSEVPVPPQAATAGPCPKEG